MSKFKVGDVVEFIGFSTTNPEIHEDLNNKYNISVGTRGIVSHGGTLFIGVMFLGDETGHAVPIRDDEIKLVGDDCAAKD